MTDKRKSEPGTAGKKLPWSGSGEPLADVEGHSHRVNRGEDAEPPADADVISDSGSGEDEPEVEGHKHKTWG
jgi:hypothetical protein